MCWESDLVWLTVDSMIQSFFLRDETPSLLAHAFGCHGKSPMKISQEYLKSQTNEFVLNSLSERGQRKQLLAYAAGAHPLSPDLTALGRALNKSSWFPTVSISQFVYSWRASEDGILGRHATFVLNEWSWENSNRADRRVYSGSVRDLPQLNLKASRRRGDGRRTACRRIQRNNPKRPLNHIPRVRRFLTQWNLGPSSPPWGVFLRTPVLQKESLY